MLLSLFGRHLLNSVVCFFVYCALRLLVGLLLFGVIA